MSVKIIKDRYENVNVDVAFDGEIIIFDPESGEILADYYQAKEDEDNA